MMKIRLQKRTAGLNFNKEGIAEAVLWAPQATKVEIKIYDTGEVLPLTRKNYGYWFLSTDRIREGSRYKFILNGEKELPDPASLSQPEGVHGPSEAINLTRFPWTDHQWKNPPLEDYILYELHTGTFTGEGTFRSLEEKLDHLRELGITAIELMPVASFPGRRNWGYDGVYPFAVQHSYGGAGQLQHLVNACHQKGIAVVLDVVYNHMGPEGNYLEAFGPYFTSRYSTPWGKAINFDDAWCDGVRNFFIENVLMWFRDFHLDGLRLDAVHAIRDFSPKHILQEIKEEVNKLMQETGRTHYLIVELDLNDTRFINPLEEHGYGMDAQWIDEFHHALRVTSGEERTGYYADFEGIVHLAKAYKDAYVYDGIYSPHRYKVFGVKAEKNPGHQFIVFSQNHDQVGNRMLGERTSRLVSFEMQKLLAASVLVSPFLPMLFMGEEYAEPNPFLYFVSHSDQALIEAVRKGRKAEFAAFHEKGEAPDPQDEQTFLRSKLQWHLLSEEPHKTMLNYYKALIGLRKRNNVLKTPARKNLEVQCDEKNNVLILHRWNKEELIICLMNFSGQTQPVSIPDTASQWNKLFDSAGPEWKGASDSPETISARDQLMLQAESILIYSDNYV